MEIALMKFYDKKNLTSLVESTYKKVLKKQESYPHKNPTYYHYQSVIERQYDSFLTTKFEDGKSYAHYQKVMEKLDVFYLLQKLIDMCETINTQKITKQNYEIALMDEVLAFITQSNYKDIPIIRIWHIALMLLQSDDKYEHYNQLKTLLVEYDTLLNQTDKRILYTYLENNSKRVFESDSYYEALFDLYSQQLETEVIYIGGYLPPRIFKNIVTVALRLKHFDWTEQFLEKNKNKILPDYEEREDVYSYSLAQLYFKQQKIDDVLDVLNRTSADVP